MRSGSMIVRAAQAIAAAQGSTDWWYHVETARSAIRALREPSPTMLEAVLPGLPDWGTLPDDWRAMIDHILVEPVAPPDCAFRIAVCGEFHGNLVPQSADSIARPDQLLPPPRRDGHRHLDR